MFERYTEKARRVIFFARYETSEFGAPSIETEHLLLGLLREDKALADRFMPPNAPVESIRKQIEAATTVREKIPTSVDLPLSHECKRILAYAAEEAERLNHRHIGTVHLLLGMLRETDSLAASILRAHGVALDEVRTRATEGKSPSERRGSVEGRRRIFLKITGKFRSFSGALTLLHHPIQIAPGIIRSPDICVVTDESVEPTLNRPPFLCIDIPTDTEPFREAEAAIDDYLKLGVRYVWLISATGHVYTATVETGLREFKDSVLRTENPTLELPLAEIFE
jgi:ATP-dependent Clp protease ATP-binding subunit ClpA